MNMTLVEAIDRPEPPSTERMLSAERVVEFVPVSVSKLYLMAKRREVRCYHLGRRVLFRLSEVIADIERLERLRDMRAVGTDSE